MVEYPSLPCIVADVETTGLVEDPGAEVIEIGCVRVEQDLSITREWSSLIKPSETCAPEVYAEAQAIHGISDEELASAPTKAEVIHELASWIDEHGLDARWTAWRLESFDLPILRKSKIWPLVAMPRTVDLHTTARDLFGTLGRPDHGPTLRDCLEHVGLPTPDDRHRALPDARCEAELAIRMIERIRNADTETMRAHILNRVGTSTVSRLQLIRWARRRGWTSSGICSDIRVLLNDGRLEAIELDRDHNPTQGPTARGGRIYGYRRKEVA